jgi:uncharacterized membrane protein YphA (DoxX/SURF4 family)
LASSRACASRAIVLFLLPVTLIMHAFWADHDPAKRQVDMINFTKNIALLGWRVPVRAPV